MNSEIRNQIEQSCSRLLTAFSNYNDAARHDEMVELFTEDGRFARPSDPTKYAVGREEILASFKARPKDRVTRHLLSNILIEAFDTHHASGQCYVLLYTAASSHIVLEYGLQANPAQLLGEFDVDFVNTEDGWKISRLTGHIALTT